MPAIITADCCVGGKGAFVIHLVIMNHTSSASQRASHWLKHEVPGAMQWGAIRLALLFDLKRLSPVSLVYNSTATQSITLETYWRVGGGPTINMDMYRK